MRLLLAALVYVGVATIASQTALFGVLWGKGLLTREKLTDMLSVAHGVDLASIRRDLTPPADEDVGERRSLQQTVEARNLLHLDLDLREIGADKGWSEMRELRRQLENDRENYQILKAAFDDRLVQLQQAGTDPELRELQIRLETMNPKQSKEQILRILDDEEIGEDRALNHVVNMVKSMPLERRKKILAEFKAGDDAKRLHAILKRIRQGALDVKLIKETRDRVTRSATPQP